MSEAEVRLQDNYCGRGSKNVCDGSFLKKIKEMMKKKKREKKRLALYELPEDFKKPQDPPVMRG